MNKLTAHVALRAITSLALLGGVFWQVSDRLAHGLFRPGEYFAYVTIQSSILAGIVMAIGCLNLFRGLDESRRFSLVRLSVTGFAVIVGVVYNAMLRGGAPDPRDLGYDWPVLPNELLHVWGPILILIDWLISSPGARVKIRETVWVLVYPVVWIGFTIVRGYATGWWPYPFLNPTKPAGVSGMVTYIIVINVFLMIVAVSVVGLSKRIHKK